MRKYIKIIIFLHLSSLRADRKGISVLQLKLYRNWIGDVGTQRHCKTLWLEGRSSFRGRAGLSKCGHSAGGAARLHLPRDKMISSISI